MQRVFEYRPQLDGGVLVRKYQRQVPANPECSRPSAAKIYSKPSINLSSKQGQRHKRAKSKNRENRNSKRFGAGRKF